jgi:hypothetical protein
MPCGTWQDPPAMIHSSIISPGCTRKFWWYILVPKPIEASLYWHMCSICGPSKTSRETCLCHFKHVMLWFQWVCWSSNIFFVKDGTSNFNKGIEELPVGLLTDTSSLLDVIKSPSSHKVPEYSSNHKFKGSWCPSCCIRLSPARKSIWISSINNKLEALVVC